MDLTEEQIDALKEVSNIAAGKAATALSQMLNMKTAVYVNVEKKIFLNTEEFHENLNFPLDSTVLGFRAPVTKDLQGVVFIIIQLKDLLKILKDFHQEDLIPSTIKDIQELDELSRSTLQEIGNILISQFCSAISDFIHILLYHEVPELVIGEYFALLDGEFAQTVQSSEDLLFLRTEITIKAQKVAGEVIFIPYYDSYKRMLDSLTLDNILGNNPSL